MTSSEEPQSDQAPPSVVAKCAGALWAGTALVTVFTYWQEPLILTLASSFRVQLLLALIAFSLAPMILFKGKRRLLFPAVPMVIGATFLSYFLPSGSGIDEVGATPQQTRICVANVYSGNRDIAGLAQFVRDDPVEILGVLEVAPHHTSALESMGFDTVLLEPRASNFGIGLLSKENPLKTQILGRETPFPMILAEFEDFQVLLAHPAPPLNNSARQVGDQLVAECAALVEASKKPTVVMGDLNATGWDLRVLPLKEAGLKDARSGFGILPTWPTHNSLMLIPIDHIFVPESWEVAECLRGPDIGSDHFPLKATLLHPARP